MKTILIILAILPFSVNAQSSTQSEVLFGCYVGIGNVNAPECRKTNSSDVGIFLEKQWRRFLSIKIESTLSFGKTVGKLQTDNEKQSLTEREFITGDFCFAVKFNIPVHRFRISAQAGPCISYFNETVKYRSMLFSDPLNHIENRNNYNGLMLGATFTGSLSYDFSQNFRLWVGISATGRLEIVGSEFSNRTIRLGCAWKLHKRTTEN